MKFINHDNILKKIKNKHSKNFFEDKKYSLIEINQVVSDFVKGKVVKPLIKF